LGGDLIIRMPKKIVAKNETGVGSGMVEQSLFEVGKEGWGIFLFGLHFLTLNLFTVMHIFNYLARKFTIFLLYILCGDLSANFH
jgi:hypothetical protein